MKTLVTADAQEAAQHVATMILDAVSDRADSVLGLATGTTMLPVYRALQTQRKHGGVSFAGVTVFMLDEYVGLSPSDPCSFLSYAQTQIGTPLGISSDRLHTPDGASDRPHRLWRLFGRDGHRLAGPHEPDHRRQHGRPSQDGDGQGDE